MDCTIQLKCGRIDFNIKQARANMDIKLQEERNDKDHNAKMEQMRMEGSVMHDHFLQPERRKMNFNNMKTHEGMDLKVQQDHNDVDYKAKMEQIRMEENMMQEHDGTGMKVVVMEFNVYVEYELSHIPQAYVNGRPGTMTFVEPHQVEWWRLADVLSTFEYKGNADVYYIKPGCISPEGMFQHLGQDDVDKMMHDHEGIKKCDFIVVKNYQCSHDDMNGQVGHNAKFVHI
ncbi:hypothetical protein ZWY2020_049412 [Hordeum vulgare]|nr:hypothetical protein ZWY2020_049412 [Hordeum vulgare]